MERRGLDSAKKVAYFEYDFDIDGGAVGTIVLRGDRFPKGAVINKGMINVKKAITSGGACTITLGVETATDVLGSTLKGAMLLDTIVDVVPTGLVATSILATTDGAKVTMTIGTVAITAGRFNLALEYY